MGFEFFFCICLSFDNISNQTHKFFFPGPYTRESMKCRKGLEAYNQFQSGWVQKLLSLNTTDETCVLIAKVLHSQRLSDEPLRPWVAIKKDGTVLCAHCNCMAGYVSFVCKNQNTRFSTIFLLALVNYTHTH